jgi:hypothetical protein
MGRGPDRRPWLILSRTEAVALQAAALRGLERGSKLEPAPSGLARALRMIDNQLRYIDGAADGVPPSIERALQREAGGDE